MKILLSVVLVSKLVTVEERTVVYGVGVHVEVAEQGRAENRNHDQAPDAGRHEAQVGSGDWRHQVCCLVEGPNEVEDNGVRKMAPKEKVE